MDLRTLKTQNIQRLGSLFEITLADTLPELYPGLTLIPLWFS